MGKKSSLEITPCKIVLKNCGALQGELAIHVTWVCVTPAGGKGQLVEDWAGLRAQLCSLRQLS